MTRDDSDADYPTPSFNRARYAPRASYRREAVHALLDGALYAHVGFVHEGRPMVIPMAVARVGETVYIHGARATRIVRPNAERIPVCITVTHLDGLVVARSAFHHSMNYRSAVVHGDARRVTDDEERSAALRAITEHVLPGRWDEVRPMSDHERKATGVLAVEIVAASVKTRTGPPVDDEEDYALPIWAGVMPVTTRLGRELDDGRVAGGTAPPPSLEAARRRFARAAASPAPGLDEAPDAARPRSR